MRHVSVFLDLEAEVALDEEEAALTGDKELDDRFVVSNREPEDGLTMSSCCMLIDMAVVAGLSINANTIDALAQYYGARSNEDKDKDKDNEEEDEDLVDMNDEATWSMIWDWTTGTLTHEAMICHIDFQYGKQVKIQYWEDVISLLTREIPGAHKEIFNST
ncbi:hypothetical protein BDN67DRAFT_1016118 [Paxillus ammoniavirescens]|nr:hypothetical protein BDN67DRAFT_1016118 [Paxillus ammoniavirescens]